MKTPIKRASTLLMACAIPLLAVACAEQAPTEVERVDTPRTLPLIAPAGGLVFTAEASFVATQHQDLGFPFGGMAFDPVAEKVEILARYTPNLTGPLTIFEFEGGRPLFGSFVRDFHNSILFGQNITAITVDADHGVAYLLQDQLIRIVIDPRHINPRNPPANDFIDFLVSETGPAGITYDERDNTLIILLRSVNTNSGQQLIRIPFSSGTILSSTPFDPTLVIDRDSELVLNPITGNYMVSVGSVAAPSRPRGPRPG